MPSSTTLKCVPWNYQEIKNGRCYIRHITRRVRTCRTSKSQYASWLEKGLLNRPHSTWDTVIYTTVWDEQRAIYSFTVALSGSQNQDRFTWIVSRADLPLAKEVHFVMEWFQPKLATEVQKGWLKKKKTTLFKTIIIQSSAHQYTASATSLLPLQTIHPSSFSGVREMGKNLEVAPGIHLISIRRLATM